MHPFLHIELIYRDIWLPTYTVLLYVALVAALAILVAGLRRELPVHKTIMLIAVTSAAALVGARLFHVVWERPAHFLEFPSEILTRFDGLTFYGALPFGLAGLWFASRRLAPQAL